MEHHDWTSPLSPCAQSGLCGGPTARLTGDANVCIYGAFQVSHISPSQMLLGSSGERGVEGEERRRDDKIWSLAWRGSGPMPLLMLPSGLLDTCTVASGVQNLAGSQGT
ncbi:hypothetical protein J3459_012085 [Metarhizium acridum]|nr:hypothetical protein J3459_012085 [Metarhizium acridum]